METPTEQEDTVHEEPVVEFNDYIDFIQQIELEQIWLRSARITNSSGGTTPDSVEVRISDSASWKESASGFQAFQKYIAEFWNGKKRLAKVEVELVADFASEDPMTDELFPTFEENNLPLNTWPYFREYVANTVYRMHWVPFTLPTRKFLSGPATAADVDRDLPSE